jgi:hypothetical protein
VAKPTDFAGEGFSTKFGEFLFKNVVKQPLRGTTELIFGLAPSKTDS